MAPKVSAGQAFKVGQVERHPACAVMPEMDKDQFAELVADIRKHGLRHPIIMHEGMILDGWNRYRACAVNGIPTSGVEWGKRGDPLDWVLSTNLSRRHLSQSQRAAIAAEAISLYAAGAAERMAAGTPSSDEDRGRSGEKAAKAAGASKATTEREKRVMDERPDLHEKVKAGEMSVNAAYKLAFPPKPRAKKKPKAEMVKCPRCDGTGKVTKPTGSLVRDQVEPNFR